MRKALLATILLTAMAATAQQPHVPYLADGVIDTTQHKALGLSMAEGVRTMTVFTPTDGSHHYANGVVMTAFKGQLLTMWQSSQTDEDATETCVVYSRSTDDGQTWTRPDTLAAATDTAYCTSGGWLAHGDTLTAFINVWPHRLSPTGGYTYYKTSTDGQHWSLPHPVLMADGERMTGIIEQDPLRMHDGRIIAAAHFQPGLHVCPIYTVDPSGSSGWRKADYKSHDRGKQSQELEPSLYQQEDGTLVMVFRDQGGSYRKMAAFSHDRGESWTEAMLTNIPDARVKQSAGNLPDGTAFLAGNPTGTKRRYPLVLLLSSDGIRFDRALLLRSGGDDLQPQRYPGRYKTLGYSYPKSMLYNGRLYVAYATNKEDVEYTVVPFPPIF